MPYQSVFRRYEMKYLLTGEQKERILHAMSPYMILDQYGRSVVRNIYFDTDTYRLIRHSIEKPAYKEKIRVRSYSKVSESDTVFVELKKKYDHIVYKRRVAMSETDAMAWVCGQNKCQDTSQITREINYFLGFYSPLRPKVFLSYEREAYYTVKKSDFRVTFDDTILCRQNDLSLGSDVGGSSLLPENTVLMEIKCSGGIPLWMVQTLSKESIYKTSFSKYGTAYEKIIYPEIFQIYREETTYADQSFQRNF